MWRKSICLTLSIVVLILSVGPLSSRTRADLMLYLPFDEGQGTTAEDLSGNNNNGEIIGEPKWVNGNSGSALVFSGAENTHHVEIADTPSLNPDKEVTLLAWIFIDTWEPTGGVVSKYIGSGNQRSYNLHMDHDTDLSFRASVSSNGAYQVGTSTTNAVAPEGTLVEGQWQHVAMTYKGDEFLRLYHNGNMVAESAATATPRLFDNTTPLMVGTDFQIGGNHNGQPREFTGVIDEVRLYNHALTKAEILAAMEGGEGYPYAYGPNPADGTLHPDTWVTLTWSPGDFAASHDVYLGDNFDDVDNGTGDTFRGNQTTMMFVAGFPGFAYPDGLVPGTTYYWRIDEVNEADPNSPWKGPIWSFSIPPKTAYNPDPANGAEFVDPNNVTLTWTPGFGAILHTVYFGDNYDAVSNATGGAPLGSATYKPGPLELEKVYYWRVDEFDAAETHKGDVWTFTTPGAVGNPQPVYGATNMQLNAILSWTPSDSAASHELYFGTDKEAVRNAETGAPEYKGSKALGAESYDPGLLDADTTYYWRVDEVDAQGNTTKGPLWVFTTGAYLLVDDFESYTDEDPNNEAIWQTWIDGFGVADNGAQVGYLLPPYAEQTIVHSGSQSMPLLYINEAGVTNSEAAMTLMAPRDWTEGDVAELSLWFRGSSSNAAEPLYAAISNNAGAPAVVAYEDAGAAQMTRWTQWNIALQAFADQGINLTNVERIAIGLGSKAGAAGPGGSGTLYVDDIRLHQP